MKKKIICYVLGTVMIVLSNQTVPALSLHEIVEVQSKDEFVMTTQADEITFQKNVQVENEMLIRNETINDLNGVYEEIQYRIRNGYVNYVEIMLLNAGMEKEKSNVEVSILEMEEQIRQTTEQLEIAEANMNAQYEEVKVHIRYLYEKNWNDVWFEVLLGSKDITIFLNNVDYVKQIQEYDHNILMEFVNVVHEVTALKESLENQKLELDAQKKSLNNLKDDLELSKEYIQNNINQMKTNNVFSNDNNIVQIKKIIKNIGLQDEEINRIIRDAIVEYADCFVGYPYVWGGDSLTTGIDCSHFVYRILKNCGLYSGEYVTSAGWVEKGRPVAGLAEAKAGDIICYQGHVAIYDGNGGIVEAKGSQWGITHDRSVNCAPILAIRRFV